MLLGESIMSIDDRYKPDTGFVSYEPKSGHPFKVDPLNILIGPRPIGWISSLSETGNANLAPYSFFSLFNYRPPIIGFSSVGEKHSLRNICKYKEFVWNLTTRNLVEKMNLTCAEVEETIDEFALAGLHKLESKHVKVPRVAESLAQFECQLSQIIQLKNSAGALLPSWLILGEVIHIHVHKKMINEGEVNGFNSGIVLRGGGPSAYLEVTHDQRFDLLRP